MLEPHRYLSGSGWTALLADTLPCSDRMENSFETEYVVVGAGYAGIAAARQLAQHQPQAEIVLLEAEELLENSSARNSGFMIELPYTKIDQRTQADQQAWQIDLMQYGKNHIWQHVKTDPEQSHYWQTKGHYKAASTVGGQKTLTQIAQVLAEKKIDYKRLSSEQCEQALGTTYYRSGLWMPHCTLVQPAALLRRLIKTLPENIQVFTQAKVTSAQKTPQGISLKIGAHTVKARQVIWAINTQLAQMNLAKSRQLAVYTYACLTEPIASKTNSLGYESVWGLTPAEQLEATLRKLPDGRLLFRTGFSYDKELPIQAQQQLFYQGLHQRYPFITKDQIAYGWGGAISMTRNGAPLFKKYDEHQVLISGCNASGILKMTALGQLGADLLLNKTSTLLTRTLMHSQPSYIPPEPFRRIGVSLMLSRLKKALNK